MKHFFQCSECTLTRQGTGPTCEECMENIFEKAAVFNPYGFHPLYMSAPDEPVLAPNRIAVVPGSV